MDVRECTNKQKKYIAPNHNKLTTKKEHVNHQGILHGNQHIMHYTETQNAGNNVAH